MWSSGQFLASIAPGRRASAGGFWTIAPSAPFPYSLFDNAPTYARPAAAYMALRQILGEPGFADALQQIQRAYGGANITEPQLETAFHQWLPEQSEGCQQRLDQFFAEWFDTAYPRGGGANRPQITGPGLDGREFYDASAGCSGGSS